jgi:CubicO group peptidase (beta-lactamase class C family)
MSSLNPESPANLIEMIEGPQEPDRGGHNRFSLMELMEKYRVPGLSIAVFKDFEIHWAKGYGVSDVATGDTVDAQTVFQAASISKPVAAMAVLRAAEDGLLNMDDDINTILRSWKMPDSLHTKDRPVTPRTLTSHTSGLSGGYYLGYHPSESVPEHLFPSEMDPTDLVRPPMTAYQYSGAGATIMQLALSDVAGKPFSEVLQETVLGPIGMTNSTFEQPLPPEHDANAARAHDSGEKAMDAKWHVYPKQAAAGLWPTPSDLAKFAIEVQKSYHDEANRVLSRSAIQEMLSPIGIGDFAIGFIIEKRGQGWYFSHTGGNWGFRCILSAHKAKGYGFAIMGNSDRGIVGEEIAKRIERVYGFDSLDEPLVY